MKSCGIFIIMFSCTCSTMRIRVSCSSTLTNCTQNVKSIGEPSSPVTLTSLCGSFSTIRRLTGNPFALNEQVFSSAVQSSTLSASTGVRLSKRDRTL